MSEGDRHAPRVDPTSFYFEIHGNLVDFAVFCAILRGDDPKDDALVAAMNRRLTASTDSLDAAVKAAKLGA